MRLRSDDGKRAGAHRYEGFCIDMVTALSEILGFTFDIYPAPGGRMGTRLANGSWDGLVGQVMNGVSTRQIYPPHKRWFRRYARSICPATTTYLLYIRTCMYTYTRTHIHCVLHELLAK